MSKPLIILSCILAISQLGNVSHAFDNVPASTRNYELSNSHEKPMVNSDEDDSNRKRGTMVLLLLLKNSKENETCLDEETEETKERIHHGQKTKRCMALNLLRKARLISMPKDAEKNVLGFAESPINDSVQNLNDEKSYFRLASRKDTNNILKRLLKSRPSKGEDNDPIVSKSHGQDPIILVSQDLKKSGNQRPKKYVCYCIEDSCVTNEPRPPSRPNAMRTTNGRNILAQNSYSTNKEIQRISGLIAPDQQDLGAPLNLHCPPGAVLVEESDYPECSDRKHHSHKRRPVKKCLPIIIPCESKAESIGQPTRINIPLAGNRKLNRRVYKVDRTLPFVQKMQSLIKQHEAPGELPCNERDSPVNSVLGVQDYYRNNQKYFDRSAQVPVAQNPVHPSPYVIYPKYSQYPQYSDRLVGEPQFPLQHIDQPYKGSQEPSYDGAALGRHFLDTEEWIKMFGPSVCTISTTPIPSGNGPKTTGNYEEEHEESTIGSQWDNEIHPTTELLSRKINKWNYPTNMHDRDKIAKTHLHEMKAGKANNKDDEKKVSHYGLYPQSRIPTKAGEYRDTVRQYFSSQPTTEKIQPSYNFPGITTSNYKTVSSTDKKPTYFEDHRNFLEPNSQIRHSNPNNIEYLTPTANSDESETEDYYDVTEAATEDEIRKIPSIGSVSKFPQLASTSNSLPQYLEYTMIPTGKGINPSLNDDISEIIAGYVSTPHGSSSRYGTSEDHYSENIFHPEHDRKVVEVTKYYTTRPSQRVGIAKQHSIYGSLSYDEKRLESSATSPNTVFMKMEKPWTNYETTIATENVKGNGFQGSQKITTVYPVIDDENHILSASPSTQDSNDRIGENAVIPSSNLYYSIQPEQTVANVAPIIETKTTPPQSPVGMIQLTPINNYSNSGFVSSSTSRTDNQYPTSHVAMQNDVYGTTPLLGISNLGRRKFTETSYPAQNNAEVKTISSWTNVIKETNIEDTQGVKKSTPHYPSRLKIADIDQYSGTPKSSHLQYIESHQLTSDEPTTDKFYTQFFGSNEPTTENVMSTTKHTDYLRKPIGRPGDKYTTSYIQNLPPEHIESINDNPLDKHLSRKVPNHYSRVPARNWNHTTQSEKKITSFIDQEASTRDHGAQAVGSYRSFTDGIITTSRSDESNKPLSRLGTTHSTTATERLQKITQQLSKMSSEYNLYASQSEKPLFTMNHRKSTQLEDLELGLPTADNNYSPEDIPNTYTTAESILGESTTADTETYKLEKNRNGKSHHPSTQSHQLINTPSKYDNNKEVKRPLETTLSFENNSDMKEEFNEYFASNTFDDKVEEVNGSDSYNEKMDPKNYNDFNSTGSDDLAVTDNNETKLIHSSTVIDEEVAVANRPKTTDASTIKNSKHNMRYHNDVVKGSSRKESTLNDKVIMETQSYKEDDDNFSPMIQTINGDMPHLYPVKNYEEKHLTTNYYEMVNPQSKDDITRISKDEFEKPSDSPYSSTPMSVTHYYSNPLTISDIFESENVVHDKSPTEGRSNDYSTNQYLQNTAETRIKNPVNHNDKSNAIFEQNKLTSQRYIVGNTLPTTSTLKKHSSAVSETKEKFITTSNQLFGKTNETQRMIPYDIIGDTPSKENLNTKIENDVSPTQTKYCTDSLAKEEPMFNTGNEKYTPRDMGRLNSHKITQPSYLLTGFSKFKDITPPSDSIGDALMPMVTTDDKAEETTILTTEMINQQNHISKKDSSLKQFTLSSDRIGNVQKAIMKLSATPIATTPETNDENAIEPIGTKNEFLADEYMYANDGSSLEHSRATEYSSHPCEPTSSSPTVGNTLSSRSFAVSDDLTLKQVLSSTSKNKESVEKPLGSDSTASIGETNLLTLFSEANAAGNSYEKYGGLNSMDQIALQPYYTEYQTTPANECTEDILNDNGISDEDRSYLTSAVQKVVQNLISPESNNAYKNAPNTQDTLPTLNEGLSSGLPVLKNLFSLPEVKDMVINTVKGLISEASEVPEDISLGRLKDQEIESILNGVVNNLVPGKGITLSPAMTVDKQQYKDGHSMVVPASLASINGEVIEKPADEMFNSIQNIIERPEIGLQGARLPAVQNIIVHAVENVLMKAKKVVDHSLIWETLNNIIARAEDAGNSILQPPSTFEPLPKIPDKKTPSGSLKNMPIIPVMERVFKNGQWSEKQTVLGITKNPFDSKLSPSTTASSNDDSELFTSSSNHKISIINPHNLKVTTNAADYALLGESEEKEDESTIQDDVEVNCNVPIEKITQSVDVTMSKPTIADKRTPSGSLKNMPIINLIERVFKNGRWSEKQTALGIREKNSNYKLSPSSTASSNDDSELCTSSSNHETSMINRNILKATTNADDYALLGESEQKEDESTTQDEVEVNGNIPIEKIIHSVDAISSKQSIEHKADPENAPIKYYSPNDRILTYIQNHQSLEGKTDTTLHSPDTDKGTKYNCLSPAMQTNEFSTVESLVKVEHATASDGDEVPAAFVETTESRESGERITSGDQSMTQTLRHKFTKIPRYYESSQEATTLPHGLFGAAKSRSQHLQENIKGSSNFVIPKSDPTYFGKLSLNDGNPSEDKISDLTNTDLFYIGDGVKIPLVIRRMSDGSYALSISEKICQKFVNQKCPCCVPNDGNIVEESRKPDVADDVEITSQKDSYDLASLGPTESSKYESESKRRYIRSTSGSNIIMTKISPVKSFVKKYNMTLNLVKDHIPQQSLTNDEKEIQEIRNTKRNKRLDSFRHTKIMNLFDNNNQIQRDDSEEPIQITDNSDDNSEVISKESNSIRRSEISYDKDINSFIHNLLHIRDVPDYQRTEIVVNALDGLIHSAKNLIPTGHQSMIKFIDEDSTDDQNQWKDSSLYDLQNVENKIAGYGYQKDNPILDRIRFIKENQHGHGQYKYQQNIDHHARGKMNILKTVLHWLRKVFLEAKGNDKN